MVQHLFVIEIKIITLKERIPINIFIVRGLDQSVNDVTPWHPDGIKNCSNMNHSTERLLSNVYKCLLEIS